MTSWDCVARKVDFNLQIIEEYIVNSASISSRTLDFGCGYGRITNQIYQLGFKNIAGVDSSEEMIKRGIEEHPTLDLSLIHI